MQMMPMGCTMMPMHGGQVHQMQMQPQSAPMPMMGMAMPAGMVTGMPGGAVMMLAAPSQSQGLVLPIAQAQGRNGMAAAPAAMLEAPSQVQRSGMAPHFQQLAAPVEKAQPQTVTCAHEADGVFRVRWTVDARKLKGNDKTVVSPPFEIPSKATGTFKMMINPAPSKLKGGATFRNSSGRGYVQLKCDTASESTLRIRFAIGHGEEEPRGPLEHNFAFNGVCGLPKEIAEWDFTKVVDEAAKTFVVCLELL